MKAKLNLLNRRDKEEQEVCVDANSLSFSGVIKVEFNSKLKGEDMGETVELLISRKQLTKIKNCFNKAAKRQKKEREFHAHCSL